MADKLVECVPNFSEGHDQGVLEAIAAAIRSVSGVELRDIDRGEATNRTVMTFTGPPEPVLEAAFQAVRTAAGLIDMRRHHGAHPRFGATDVCPFVPVEGMTMEECVELARRLGRRVGLELGIPVYLYERAASVPERRNLANVRRGEYEGLAEKLAEPAWRPDFGPAALNERAGAIAIGAREFLIAYNITLNTDDPKAATDIAFELRAKGRSVRTGNTDPIYQNGTLLKYAPGALRCGECPFEAPDYPTLAGHVRELHGYDLGWLLGEHDLCPKSMAGQSVKKRGLFDHCKAIGWYVREYGRAQISINLTDWRTTPPHLVLEKARELAAARGLVVTGSEIVGLVPLQPMLEAGRYYLRRQGRSAGLPPIDLVRTAVWSMGLADVSPFDPAAKILGLPQPAPQALVSLSAAGFIDEVSRPSPAPGGGSVAALAGSLGAALASMVANLTAQKGIETERLATLAERAQTLKAGLLSAVDDDTAAFNDYLAALRLPQATEAEQTARKAAIQAGLRSAIEIPLTTARRSFEALELAADVARTGMKASVSDAGVAAQMAYSGIVGGVLNVLINLKGLTDEPFKAGMRTECTRLKDDGLAILGETWKTAIERIG